MAAGRPASVDGEGSARAIVLAVAGVNRWTDESVGSGVYQPEFEDTNTSHPGCECEHFLKSPEGHDVPEKLELDIP